MTLRRIASSLLLFCGAAAPWIAGTNVSLPGAAWWLASPLVASLVCVVVARARAREKLDVPALAILAVTFLLGCLAWWCTRSELPFATAFAASHWEFFRQSSSAVLLHWPRHEQLVFLIGCLCGFLAVADLGRSAAFSRALLAVVGASGIALALCSVGQRELGWPPLPWATIGDRAEAFNVSFYHYSGFSAAVNVGWPLLVFGGIAPSGWGRRLVQITTLAIVGASLARWESAAAQVIAAGMFVTGLALTWARRRAFLSPSPRLLFAGVAAAFVLIGAWQWTSVRAMLAQMPDTWSSAEATRLQAPERDRLFQEQGKARGDRLVISPTPDRRQIWLTGARMAADHPLIGPGPASWVKTVALYSNDSFVNTFLHYCQFAHNDLVQTAAEWGGLPALAFLVLWAGGFWRALHPAELRASDPRLAVFVTLLGLALHSMVDFPLQYPALQLWSLLLLGLLWSRSSAADAA